jgi:hypothetical protein
MIPLLIIWLLFSPLAGYTPGISIGHPETDEKIKAAMRYHGTLDTYEVAPGTWKFMREGQECSLLTKSFERRYR